MNLKKHYLLVPVILSLASTAGAQGNMNGAVGVLEDSSLSGSFTASSLTLDSSNFTQPASATGTFIGTVPDGTEVTAYSSTISGLSATPLTVSISNFLLIGTPGPVLPPPFSQSPGTTPNNRFEFNLQTLEEPASGSFVGFGTLIDTAPTGAYSPTAAEIDLSFSGANNYSFVLETVPEPTTLTLVLAGLGLLPLLRRKI
ncbi:MAG TPA: PEP-CTERM sorting domain-containing protein [Verrucomicrobiae bacterium]|jgi:hypothetical protein|nr:PEP-CTERM sorting domain-containing protein [Verrucomicrobiae bacterium]